jgi:hypothetical protein
MNDLLSLLQPSGPYDGYMVSGSRLALPTSSTRISENSAPPADSASTTYAPSHDGIALVIVVVTPAL